MEWCVLAVIECGPLLSEWYLNYECGMNTIFMKMDKFEIDLCNVTICVFSQEKLTDIECSPLLSEWYLNYECGMNTIFMKMDKFEIDLGSVMICVFSQEKLTNKLRVLKFYIPLSQMPFKEAKMCYVNFNVCN